MGVGKTRKTDKHLPRRLYLKHGAYWHVSSANKWTNLGPNYGDALKRYAGLIEQGGNDRIDLLIGRYEYEVLPKRAKDTIKGRKKEFKRIRAVFGLMSPKDLKASDAWEYFQKRGANQAARHEIRALSAVMGWAVKWGAVEANPLRNIGFPTFKPRDRYVTDAEFVAVRSIALPMIRYAMNIALITAARQRDILTMERRQIADGLLTIRASKTGKKQTFPVAGDLKDNIEAALKQSPQLRPHVIVNRKGKPYSCDGFQSQWQRVMKNAIRLSLIQDRFTFHDIRAKNLSEAKTLEEAASRARHADPRITQDVYRRLPEVSTVADISHLLDKRKEY